MTHHWNAISEPDLSPFSIRSWTKHKLCHKFYLLQLQHAPLQGLLHLRLQHKVGYGQSLTPKSLNPSSIAQVALMPSLKCGSTQKRSQYHGMESHFFGGKWMNKHFSLSKVAKKYLGVIATLVPAERIFSKVSDSDKERGLRCRIAGVMTGFILLNCNSSVWIDKSIAMKIYEDRQDKHDIEHAKRKALPKEESTLILNTWL